MITRLATYMGRPTIVALWDFDNPTSNRPREE